MNNSSPSKFLLKFFRWFCDPNLVEGIEGDLMERFELRAAKIGHRAAQRKFAKDVFQLIRPGIIKSFTGNQKLNLLGMLQHNLLISFRSFLRYKSSFFINLIGLSSGLACAIFIYLWVQDERSTDRFHEKNDQLVQVMLHHEESGTLNTQEDTQGILAAALEEDVPEIITAIQATPSFWFGKMPLTNEENVAIKASGKFVDYRYFELFSFPLIQGDASSVLKAQENIVISESLALSLFGTTDNIIGKTLDWQLLHFNMPVQVSGVFKDVPKNSTEEFDFVLSFEIFRGIVGDGLHWGNYNALTYALVEKNTDLELLNEKLAPFVKNKVEWSNVIPFVRPYADRHLYGKYENGVQSGGRIEYVKLFTIISIFIVLIACINFMNLSTAKASRKTKEVGVKKAIGAGKGTLIFQYLQESLLLTFISALFALGLVALLLPQFNQLTSKAIELSFDAQLLKGLLIIILLTGLVAGSYPAFYLSGFKPAEVLKSRIKTSLGELWVRKGLVVFQFSLSVILIVSVLVISEQINYVQNKNLGYNKVNLVLFASEGKIASDLSGFVDQVNNIPGVIQASCTGHDIIKGGNYTTDLNWEGKNPEVETRFANMGVDYGFIETLGVDIIEGRSFSSELVSDSSKIIFNEKAIEVMGIEDPVGKKVKLWGRDVQIIGIAKDFHFESLHEPVTPLFFLLERGLLRNILVRIEGGQERGALERLEDKYKEFNPELTFDYAFLDQSYAQQYAAEEKVSSLAKYFSGLTIIISCLGLFGLAVFTTETRSKEIGIRKVLGASSLSIIKLVSNDFNKIVGLAIIISLPLSYFLISEWLKGFAYTIELKTWYFIGSGLLALLVAWLTIGLQTFKAAFSNPVQRLRSE